MQTLGDRTKTGWPLLVCLGVSAVTFFLPWIEIQIRYVGERGPGEPGLLAFLFGPLGRVVEGGLQATQTIEVKTLYQSGADASLGTFRTQWLGWDLRPGPVPWNPLGAQPRAGMLPSSPLAVAYGLLLLGAFGFWCWSGDSRRGNFAAPSCLALGVLCLMLIPRADASLRTALDQKALSTIRYSTPRQTDVWAKAPPTNSGDLTRQSITIRYTVGYYGAVATTLAALAAALLLSLRRVHPPRAMLEVPVGSRAAIAELGVAPDRPLE